MAMSMLCEAVLKQVCHSFKDFWT